MSAGHTSGSATTDWFCTSKSNYPDTSQAETRRLAAHGIQRTESHHLARDSRTGRGSIANRAIRTRNSVRGSGTIERANVGEGESKAQRIWLPAPLNKHR